MSRTALQADAEFRPLRLFYSQNIYTITPALTGRSDEIPQIDIRGKGASAIADVLAKQFEIERVGKLHSYERYCRICDAVIIA